MPRSSLGPRRAGALVLILFVGFMGGCAPADPLEVKVHARTMSEYQRWHEYVLRDLDRPLAREFEDAVRHLGTVTGGTALVREENDLYDSRNPFCRRVHGRTIRTVIIDALGSEDTFLVRQRELLQDRLGKLYLRQADSDADLRREIGQVTALIEECNTRIDRNEARIVELRPPRLK